MPQIANQDYNFIDFDVLPYYEGIERLYRAYLNGTAFDCVVKRGNAVNKIVAYEEVQYEGGVSLQFNDGALFYIINGLLTTEDNGFLISDNIYIVSADGFKLKPVVNDDNILTGVEVTTEKVENNASAQYFKDWMIGQPVEEGGE